MTNKAEFLMVEMSFAEKSTFMTSSKTCLLSLKLNIFLQLKKDIKAILNHSALADHQWLFVDQEDMKTIQSFFFYFKTISLINS